MCGITASISLPLAGDGRVSDDGGVRAALQRQLEASLEAINHRGPDDSGTWISDDCNVALGHCRLTINDLTASGRQPLTSDDGGIRAIVNGEIYDHDRLRKLCREEYGYTFAGESDSELVLALYKIYGSPGFFAHLRGEFSFVLHDERDAAAPKVIAARDRFAIRPLFWTVQGDTLLLAAEVKALIPLGWKPEWDLAAVATSRWQRDERTMFKGVRKILPGYYMEVTQAGMATHGYWDGDYNDKNNVETRTDEEMIQGVHDRLVEAIRLRLRADVPIGVYLSGGIDSSAVAGIASKLIQEHNRNRNSNGTNGVNGTKNHPKLTCFTIEFPSSPTCNETPIAERTAAHIDATLHKTQITESTLAAFFAPAAFHCEQPNWNLNSVAKYALSALAQQHGFKVVLTGEGADEHFNGYPQLVAETLREADLATPGSFLATHDELRQKMHAGAEAQLWEALKDFGNVGQSGGKENPALAEVNGSVVAWGILIWNAAARLFKEPVAEKVRGMNLVQGVLDSYSADVRAKMKSVWHPLHAGLYMWNKSTLANLLLTSLGDRTEMAHSVEGRTPFLDHNLTEYVNGLPPSVKSRFPPGGGEGEKKSPFKDKWILREAVRPYITEEVYTRAKKPLLAPATYPKDGPLQRMFEELLTREAVEGLGFVEWTAVETALGEAFGDEARPAALEALMQVGAWVVIGERMGMARADVQCWED